MSFIQESNEKGVHGEQKTASFIAEEEKQALTYIKDMQSKTIDYTSKKIGDVIGKEISGTSKGSLREVTRNASKEAAKKAAEETTKQAIKETTKYVSKETTQKTASFIVTSSAGTATSAVATTAGTATGATAGTAVNPVLGTVIGFVVGNKIGNILGDVAGNAIDGNIVRISTKQKMIEGLNELSEDGGDGNGPIKSLGQSILMELGAFFRRMGSVGKIVMPPSLVAVTAISLFLIIVPLLVVPLLFLFGIDYSGYAGGYVDNCVYYSQYEEPWRNMTITPGNTIRNSGCGPTTLAIVYSTLTGDVITPDVAAAWLVENGYYRNGLTWWSTFSYGIEELGLEAENHGKDLSAALECIPEGGMVVISVGKPDGGGNALYRGNGHFMAIRGVTDEGKILVADPASRKNTEEKEWDYATVEEILKNCWSVTYHPSVEE